MTPIPGAASQPPLSFLAWRESEEDLSTPEGLRLLHLYEVNFSKGPDSFFEALSFMLQRHEENSGQALLMEDKRLSPITPSGLRYLAEQTIKENLDEGLHRRISSAAHQELMQMTIARLLDIDIEILSGANHASTNDSPKAARRESRRLSLIMVKKPGDAMGTHCYSATQIIATANKPAPHRKGPVGRERQCRARLSEEQIYAESVEEWYRSDFYKNRFKSRIEPGNWALEEKWLMQPRT